MQSFKDFKIKPKENDFVGDKIKPQKAMNVKISVLHYVIEPSTINPGKDRLKLQIIKNDEKNIVFFGSENLIYQISQVPKDGFPFDTAVVFQNGRLEFT